MHLLNQQEYKNAKKHQMILSFKKKKRKIKINFIFYRGEKYYKMADNLLKHPEIKKVHRIEVNFKLIPKYIFKF